MRIIGCDLHSRQQTLAMLDTATGEIEKTTLKHEENIVREFCSNLPRPVRVGIEATGSMQWFVSLMEELRIECLVGHPAEIRAAEPRKQKHDRRDADLLLSLLVEERFPLERANGGTRSSHRQKAMVSHRAFRHAVLFCWPGFCSCG